MNWRACFMFRGAGHSQIAFTLPLSGSLPFIPTVCPRINTCGWQIWNFLPEKVAPASAALCRMWFTVTSKTVAMPNPNTAREARCNHSWELRFALVGTNKVQTLGYKSVPGSRDAAHSSWRYNHFKMTTPLQRFCTLGIDQAFSTWYNLLLPRLLLKSF